MVNHHGRDGTAPDPLVWSAGALPKRRRLVHAVLDWAFLPGPPGIWDSEWVNVHKVTGVSSAGAGFFAHLLPAGIIGVGVMLIQLARLVMSIVAGVFSLFLGLSSLFNVLNYGVFFLLYNPLVLSILVLII